MTQPTILIMSLCSALALGCSSLAAAPVAASGISAPNEVIQTTSTPAQSISSGAPINFGDAKVKHGAPVDLNQLLATPERFRDGTITVQGTIAAVCAKRGCWMRLHVADGQTLQVKVRDGDMEFPVSAKGKTAIATGQLNISEIDIESQREQLAEDAAAQGKTFDPASVTTVKKVLQFVPVAVTIQARAS
jgi:hypothetical protein